jgi:hypothetical protein
VHDSSCTYILIAIMMDDNRTCIYDRVRVIIMTIALKLELTRINASRYRCNATNNNYEITCSTFQQRLMMARAGEFR